MVRRSGGVIVAGLCALAMARGAAAAPVKGISKEMCSARAGRLMKLLGDAKTAGHPVIYDADGFWKAIGAPDGKAGRMRLAQYINLEDGSTTLPAVRSGYEVALYNRIKAFILSHKAGELGPNEILVMAVEVVGAGKSLQLALLTAHNVVRLMARPQQWAGDAPDGLRPGTGQVGHPDSDPGRAVILDLLGRKSTSDGPTLAEALKIPRRAQADPKKPALVVGEVLQPLWSMEVLFKPQSGVFQTQPGSPSAEWNAGASYYFWIGALAQTTLGTAAVLKGVTGEGSAKTAGGAKQQGAFEISHFVCGGMFGSAAFKARKTLGK